MTVINSVAEATRLATLDRYGILDTEREPVFDDIATLARELLGATASMVCLIDKERQWFKAEAGVTELMGELRETPLEISFCVHAIVSDDVMIVHDATTDARFANNPMVMDYPHIRSYAGAPLVVGEGIRLGTVCVLDQNVREFTDKEIATLKTLRDAATAHMEMRRSGPDTYVAICGWCQKLMSPVPEKESTKVTFTHGICAECSESMTTELAQINAHCLSCGADFSVNERSIVTTDERRWTRCPSCKGTVAMGRD